MHSQFQPWLDTAKDNLKSNTKRRLYGRIDGLEELINNGVSPYGTHFVIDETLKKKICQQLLAAIDQYGGTRKLAKGQETSIENVIANTRTWWNRKKSLQLGSHLFAVICFYVLHHFIQTQCAPLSSKQRLMLFLDIFITFLDETIKFPKTKPKPLIVQQCFLHNGAFKEICSELIKTFGDESIEWNCYIPTVGICMENGKKTTKYIKKKDRSKTLYKEFYECLGKIKEKWSTADDVNVDAVMQEWDETLRKHKPKSYSLSFFEIGAHSHDLMTDTSSVEECVSTGYTRSFQGMGGFGCGLSHQLMYEAQNDSQRRARSERQEAHIEQMRAILSTNMNDLNDVEEMDFHFDCANIINFDDSELEWNQWTSDNETTYNVI
eukprot:498500_1